MNGVRNGIVRPRGRPVVIAAAIAFAAVFMITPTNAAAVTLQTVGSTGPAIRCFTPPPLDLVPLTTGPTRNSYAVKTAGFITDWSMLAGTTWLGPIGLLVWRPVSPGPFQLVASTPTTTLQPGVLNKIPVDPLKPIQVQVGDVIGLRVAGDVDCAQLGGTGDSMGSTPGPIADLATPALTAWATNSSIFLNLSATVSDSLTLPPPPTTTPKTKDDCKDGGWQHFVDAAGNPFKNQGECVAFVESLEEHITVGDQNGSAADQTTESDHASTDPTDSEAGG